MQHSHLDFLACGLEPQPCNLNLKLRLRSQTQTQTQTFTNTTTMATRMTATLGDTTRPRRSDSPSLQIFSSNRAAGMQASRAHRRTLHRTGGEHHSCDEDRDGTWDPKVPRGRSNRRSDLDRLPTEHHLQTLRQTQRTGTEAPRRLSCWHRLA